jgi:hypothetical protein
MGPRRDVNLGFEERRSIEQKKNCLVIVLSLVVSKQALIKTQICQDNISLKNLKLSKVFAKFKRLLIH